MDITLGQMLAVEDEPALQDFVCAETGISLWTQIRIVYLEAMMSDLLYAGTLTGRARTSAAPVRAMTTLARSVARNGRFALTGADRADICILGNGIADEWHGDRWFNRLTDHFAQASPAHSLVIADQYDWRWAFPRQHERTLLHAPRQAWQVAVGRAMVRSHHRERARQLIDLVDARALGALGWSPGASRRQDMIERLARKSAALPYKLSGYDAMLARIAPRVLMVDAACYGPAAPLIAAARRRGIATAEYQHGSISGGHIAYNFAPARLADAAFMSTLPEYFLSYGSWWSAQVNAPVRHCIVGNPHRSTKLEAEPASRDRQDGVLILSDGIDFDRYLNLARQLQPAASADGLRVRLRPHPLERAQVRERHGAQVDGIDIDTTPDLYASLRHAQAVVSEVSTGLFEAVGIVPRLYLWDTPKARFSFPSHPFESFRTAGELVERLRQPGSGSLRAQGSEAIWAEGWQRRYAEFLDARHVGGAR